MRVRTVCAPATRAAVCALPADDADAFLGGIVGGQASTATRALRCATSKRHCDARRGVAASAQHGRNSRQSARELDSISALKLVVHSVVAYRSYKAQTGVSMEAAHRRPARRG